MTSILAYIFLTGWAFVSLTMVVGWSLYALRPAHSIHTSTRPQPAE